MVNAVHISIVTPVYGCCKSLNNLYERLNETLSTITDNLYTNEVDKNILCTNNKNVILVNSIKNKFFEEICHIKSE